MQWPEASRVSALVGDPDNSHLFAVTKLDMALDNDQSVVDGRRRHRQSLPDCSASNPDA
jgi:hypothetical protein